MKKSIIIETLQGTFEATMQEWINTKQELAEVRIELEETQEALRRSRRLLESYNEYKERTDLTIKRLERGITQNWFLSDWYEGIVEVLPGGIDEGMIECTLIDKEKNKIAILIK